MKAISEKQLIISLIKDDLINTRLVNGLNAIGLMADDYLLHLSDTIFKLMGIPDDPRGEEIFEYYMDLLKKVEAVDVTESHAPLDDLALEIFIELSLKKS